MVVEEIFKVYSQAGMGSNSVSGVHLVAPFSDVDKLLAAHLKIRLFLRASCCDTCPRVHASVYRDSCVST